MKLLYERETGLIEEEEEKETYYGWGTAPIRVTYTRPGPVFDELLVNWAEYVARAIERNRQQEIRP